MEDDLGEVRQKQGDQAGSCCKTWRDGIFYHNLFFSPPKMARKKWRDRAYLMQIVLNTTCFKWVSPLVYASQSYNSMIQLYRTTTKATVEVSYINSKKNYTHSFYSIAILDFKLKLNIFLFSTTEKSCKTISPSWAHLCSVQQVWTI